MARSTKASAKDAAAAPAAAPGEAAPKASSPKRSAVKATLEKVLGSRPKSADAGAGVGAESRARGEAPRLQTPTDLGSNTTRDVAGALNALLADFIALYMKTKNFHWHVSGPHFRDYHLLFDAQSDQLSETFDAIGERVRKTGGTTLRSTGHAARLQRIKDNDAEYVTPLDMLGELRSDNQALIASMREAHDVCDDHNDVATASLLENWIDEAEERVWFLYEASRTGQETGH